MSFGSPSNDKEDLNIRPISMIAPTNPSSKKKCDRQSNFNKGSNIPGLYSHPQGVTQNEGSPRPRMPGPKVRDLGREILERANKATWFDDMLDSHVGFDEKLVPLETTNTTTTTTTTTSTTDAAAAVAEVVVPKEDGETGDIVDNRDDDDLDKSMDMLKRLGEQQRELLQKQKVLQHQIEMNQAAGQKLTAAKTQDLEVKPQEEKEAPPSPVVAEAQEAAEAQAAAEGQAAAPPAAKKGQWQRRLKGDIAQMNAKRSEGTLKSIIWFQDNER